MTEKNRISNLLNEYGFTAKKSFGQNFLINEGIINRIVNNMKPEEYDTVIEIGPGLASLTLPLSKRSKVLYAVDADRDMIKVLNDIFKDANNVNIVQSDFLRFEIDKISSKDNRLILGNLPYNITSELLEYLLNKGFKTAGAMVQKEVFDKLDYKIGKKDNTAMGAFIACSGKLSLVTNVEHSCFDPAPKVESAFIRIDLEKHLDFKLYPIFKAMFKDPNKTISNCLKQYPKYKEHVSKLVAMYPDELSSRARQLDPNKILEIATYLLELE